MSINRDEPRWPRPEPKQYALLHHAVTLADQLQAAGCREGSWNVDRDAVAQFWWPKIDVQLDLRSNGDAWCNLGGALIPFRVGDPLPPELIAAIKATEGA